VRILCVEDDPELAEILRRALTEQLHTVEVVHDGESARHTALSEDFDLVVLDVMLPKIDGIGVCRALRAAGKLTPVIMLTARDGVDDRVLGLDVGADDYVVKPFAMSELFARIRAVARRAERRTSDVLRVRDLVLDPSTSFVRVGSRVVRLAAKEFALLHYFMQNPGKILSRAQILEHVWDANYDGFGNVVEVYVNYLRNKIEDGKRRRIETVRGRGYVLRDTTDGA
jgi:DNA-binding response OmpR family regulator